MFTIVHSQATASESLMFSSFTGFACGKKACYMHLQSHLATTGEAHTPCVRLHSLNHANMEHLHFASANMGASQEKPCSSRT